MADKPTILQLIVDLREQLVLLGFSGVSGACIRAVMAPEGEIKRRVMQGVAGAFSAIFLGGLLATVFDNTFGGGPYAYLAFGFIMGSGGETAAKVAQDKLLGSKKY
ncbi:hypothetical protein OEG84_11495 [Hoeflea sp. G2-23]|uniref:Holin n=1 Tax=Hoeflea algicola TaxID=2983763 RepID=A0ABT3Z966_9HYPH|nr:hypothetical protein [Hoeflea algicola]MCY0148317.1 hypothetical protein [Hoeflea algicola]